MGTATNGRYRRTGEERFCALLTAWLDTLPPAGWTGTAFDLTGALDEADRKFKTRARVPIGPGVSKALVAHETILTAAGWSVEFNRTKSERTITIRKTKRKAKGAKGA
jgi:hypothetical protein